MVDNNWIEGCGYKYNTVQDEQEEKEEEENSQKDNEKCAQLEPLP
jgi:hypothetical protein